MSNDDNASRAFKDFKMISYHQTLTLINSEEMEKGSSTLTEREAWQYNDVL